MNTATRPPERLNPQPGPRMPTCTRSAAHGLTAHRTEPHGAGAFESLEPLSTIRSADSGTLSPAPTPGRAHARAREEVTR